MLLNAAFLPVVIDVIINRGTKIMYYGLTNYRQLEEIILSVCGKLGGGPNAVSLMLGTCAAETCLGKAPDIHALSGYGLFQLDKIAIVDVIQRTRPHHKELIADEYQIDIDSVEPNDLDNSPLLAAIFCRLFYILIPEPIPKGDEKQALYWKRYYNTAAGAGTVSHYLKQGEQLYKTDLFNVISD